MHHISKADSFGLTGLCILSAYQSLATCLDWTRGVFSFFFSCFHIRMFGRYTPELSCETACVSDTDGTAGSVFSLQHGTTQCVYLQRLRDVLSNNNFAAVSPQINVLIRICFYASAPANSQWPEELGGKFCETYECKISDDSKEFFHIWRKHSLELGFHLCSPRSKVTMNSCYCVSVQEDLQCWKQIKQRIT